MPLGMDQRALCRPGDKGTATVVDAAVVEVEVDMESTSALSDALSADLQHIVKHYVSFLVRVNVALQCIMVSKAAKHSMS